MKRGIRFFKDSFLKGWSFLSTQPYNSPVGNQENNLKSDRLSDVKKFTRFYINLLHLPLHSKSPFYRDSWLKNNLHDLIFHIDKEYLSDINTNALNFITSVGIAPHPPLSPVGRGEGEGPIVKKLNAFVLVRSIFNTSKFGFFISNMNGCTEGRWPFLHSSE